MLAFALAVGVVKAATAASPMLLTTHDLPPYSFLNTQGQADGLAVRVVLCATKRMGHAVQVNFFPWKRSQLLVEMGEADAFFAASKSSARDTYAVLSATIAPQQWMWYQLDNNRFLPGTAEFKASAMTSSFLGANMQDWLVEQGFQTTAPPRVNVQLLQLLSNARVDAVLANRLVMEQLLREYDKPVKLRSTLALDKPLGVYVSKRYLATQPPEFMAQFNAAIGRCNPLLKAH